MKQHTLAEAIAHTGVGLHSGVSTHVRILPADAGSGRYFVRVDLPDSPTIPAQVAVVSQTVLSTQLGGGETGVRTVEHLLAALAGMGVDNARIEIDGPEIPLLDGSAQEWVTSIAEVGLVAQAVTNNLASFDIQEPIWIHQDDAFVAAIPASETRFSYGIDFDLPALVINGTVGHSLPSQILASLKKLPLLVLLVYYIKSNIYKSLG